jgi:uncharacterized membrane protein YkvA (DUF1232 family)
LPILVDESAFQLRSKLLLWSNVKKLKTKSSRRAPSRNVSRKIVGPETREKAALRSDAFDRALLNARSVATDNGQLRELLSQAAEKIVSIPKEPFKETWPYLQAMLRLVRAYSRSEYRAVSQEGLHAIIAALNYLVDPFDLIPDEVPFLGFIDDATVVEFAVRNSREDLEDFMTWEMVAP